MSEDQRMERWLDEWEACRQVNPALSPAEFLTMRSQDVPADLIEGLRNAIAELARSDELLRRMKSLDRKFVRFHRGFGRERPDDDP